MSKQSWTVDYSDNRANIESFFYVLADEATRGCDLCVVADNVEIWLKNGCYITKVEKTPR